MFHALDSTEIVLADVILIEMQRGYVEVLQVPVCRSKYFSP